MKYFKVASMRDTKKKSVIEVDADGYSLLLYRDKEDGIYCLKNCCSHDQSELFGGVVTDDIITCPQHGAKFNLKTGEAVLMPAVVGVEVFPVKVEGDMIFIGIEDE
jgi:3-phenylpropionate/trans-cinnamate dioxygenase ferredoxin subunit